MVQQLSLVALFPHSKYVQTMSTLRALTGIEKPQDISTYTLLTKPYSEFKPKVEPGKVNQIEQYFMKCITTWDDSTSEKLDISVPIIISSNDELNLWVDTLFGESNGKTRRNWTLQISDIPTAGKNQTVSAQTVYESTLVHYHTTNTKKASLANGEQNKVEPVDTEMKDADADADIKEVREVKVENQEDSSLNTNTTTDSFLLFLHDLGYEVKNQYWIKGVRYFHGDIFIETFKVFVRDDDFQSKDNQIKLKLLDSTNTFQVKVYINVPKATDVELINQGTKDLQKFQDFIKNLISLEIPDRMYMDSRVLKS